MEQLTPNALKMMSENSETTNPVLVQIQSIDPTPLQNKANSKLQEAIVSDGFACRKVILVNPNPNIVQSKSHPIIEIKNWTSKGSLILVRESEIVYLDYKDQIGNPMPYDEYEKNKYENPRGNNQIVHNQTKFKTSTSETHKKSQKISIKSDKKPMQSQQQQQQKAIQKIQEEQNQTQLCNIKDLYPGIQAFKIKAKIVAKSNVTNFKSGKGHFFTIELIDAESTQIQGSFFNETCDKFSSILNVGSVYTFSKGQVKMNRYSQPKQFPLQINFEEYSQIQELQDDMQIKLAKMEIKKIQQVEHLGNEERCDVLVVVKDVAPVYNQKLKNGDTKPKRTYQILDQTGSIEVTFWGGQAEQFNFNAGQIIALRQLRVGSFQEAKNLQGTTTTQVEVLDEELSKIQGYNELYQWFNNNKENIKYTQQNQNQSKNKLKYLKDIEEEAQKNSGDINYKKFNEVRCVNIAMNNKNTHFYASCGKCNKKCETINNNEFRCSSCSEKVHQPIWKYILTIKLIDESGSLWVTFMDNQGSQLLSVDAQKYSQQNDDQKQIILSNALYQEYRYLLLTKIEEYQGQYKIKHQVTKIVEADYTNESQEMFERLCEYIR